MSDVIQGQKPTDAEYEEIINDLRDRLRDSTQHSKELLEQRDETISELRGELSSQHREISSLKIEHVSLIDSIGELLGVMGQIIPHVQPESLRGVHAMFLEGANAFYAEIKAADPHYPKEV